MKNIKIFFFCFINIALYSSDHSTQLTCAQNQSTSFHLDPYSQNTENKTNSLLHDNIENIQVYSCFGSYQRTYDQEDSSIKVFITPKKEHPIANINAQLENLNQYNLTITFDDDNIYKHPIHIYYPNAFNGTCSIAIHTDYTEIIFQCVKQRLYGIKSQKECLADFLKNAQCSLSNQEQNISNNDDQSFSNISNVSAAE